MKVQLIDYFKVFKTLQLKKLQKTGNVKIIQDKLLLRKILCIQGSVSTQNLYPFPCSSYPSLLFNQKYLYLLSYAQISKPFTFQITYTLSNKEYKIICSNLYKEEFKRKNDSVFYFRIDIPKDKWMVLVIDLYSLVNWNFQFKHDHDLRIGFKITNIQLRATSKVKGMFQADHLYGPHNMPKQMELPLKADQNFFTKYAFFVTGLNLTQQLIEQIQSYKQKSLLQSKLQSSKSINTKRQVKSDNINAGRQVKPDNIKSQKSVKKQSELKINRQKNKSRQKVLNSQKSIQKVQIKKDGSKKGKIMLKDKKTSRQQVVNKQQEQQQQVVLKPPLPCSSIELSLASIQAVTICHQNLITCESHITSPLLLALPKKINNLYKSRLGKCLISYVDNSISLIDLIRKQTITYFKSELEQIHQVLVDYDGVVVIVGLDKGKRQVIIIVRDNALVFRQISNFNIRHIKFLTQQTFEQGLITYGYQNVRIWTVSQNNHVINGTSIYLGKIARNVTYQDCCIVESIAGAYAFVCDTQGYVTKINISQKKMQGVVKVDNYAIDHIKLIKYLNNQQKLLICNQKGTIKLLNCTSMQSQLQYPLNQRIKNLFLSHLSSSQYQIPNLILQTYKKTIAQLNLVTSTFHFTLRSHDQPITHLVNSHQKNKTNKFITAGLDSTLRIWKGIQLQDGKNTYKQEYQFLINNQQIKFIVYNTTANKQFVYFITQQRKIRKISTQTYQIAKQKILPNVTQSSQNDVLAFSINTQGKLLLIVSQSQVLILDDQLQVVQFQDLGEQNQFISTKKKIKSYEHQLNYICGFNSIKKSLFYISPASKCIQFYQLKNLQSILFKIGIQPSQPVICLQWQNSSIHILNCTSYQYYQNDNLLRIIPLNQSFNKNITINSIIMSFPFVCKAYTNQQSKESFIDFTMVTVNGLTQHIRMPDIVDKIILNNVQYHQFNHSYYGEIICAGKNSYGLFSVKFLINNISNQLNIIQYDLESQQINKSVSFLQNAKISKISHVNQQNENMMDISFSETATMFMGQIPQKNVQSSYNQNIKHPVELKKLYQQEEKIFQQCKKAVFGNFFDQKEENQNEQIQTNNKEQQNTLNREQGNIRMKVFLGYQPNQSLLTEKQIVTKKPIAMQSQYLGNFHWSSELKQTCLLTNNYKSLLIHKFTQPSINQKLIHLYSRPTSICWSQDKENIQYYVVCVESVIKLYNFGNNMAYIRSIQSQLLINDKHVIVDAFVTNCNSYLVVLTYKHCSTPQHKLYIFILQLSTGKIISSSYRSLVVSNYKTILIYQKHIQSTYSLIPNRYNTQLQFVLKGKNQLAFYRVTSMFTLQMLQMDQIGMITQQKTQAMITGKYVKVQNQTYLLIGTQNGALIIIDSRTGSIVLVLMDLLANQGNTIKNIQINGIQFIQQEKRLSQQYQECIIPCRLIFYSTNSNIIKIFTLNNGLNSLIQQLDNNQSISSKCINLDTPILSVSTINNTCQLIITKSSTLWLVDYEDLCSIKIIKAHSANINEAYLMNNQNQLEHKQEQDLFISCSEDGYVTGTDMNKLEQSFQIYKPRKNATSVDIHGHYIVCGFKSQVYFYDTFTDSNSSLDYLGSLQFQDQTVLKLKNITLTDNYYILTDKKIYIIFVKRKQTKSNMNNSKFTTYNKSQLTLKQSQLNSEISKIQKAKIQIQKVKIQIQIKQITSFKQSIPLWIQMNGLKPYDQFCIGYKGGKVQTWQRKCLKRTLNPLSQLSVVSSLQYYLMDVYHPKDTLHPLIKFISSNEYLISLSQQNKFQKRNYKQHSIIGQIVLSQSVLEGISAFNYVVETNQDNTYGNYYFNAKAWKGPLLFIADNYGYFKISDANGLLLEKLKVFDQPIQCIDVTHTYRKSNKINILLKNSRYISAFEVGS